MSPLSVAKITLIANEFSYYYHMAIAYTRTILRSSVPLSGSTDGTNRTFAFPEKFKQGSTSVYHNGRHLNLNGEYTENVSGGVYQSITITAFTPNAHSQIIADYILA